MPSDYTPFCYINHQCFSFILTFPGVWKTAEITPIPKQGNYELPYNNRPISLLPALSKVCERVAYNQFVTYLTTKKRLTTKQNGNKKWHCTETSLLHTTDAFLKGKDNKKLIACVLLDMSKAFDSVDHQILLRKLQDVGASASVLQWFLKLINNSSSDKPIACPRLGQIDAP